MKIRAEKLNLYEFAAKQREDSARLARAFAPVVALDNRELSLNPVFKLALIAIAGSGKSSFFADIQNYFADNETSETDDRNNYQTEKAGLIRGFDLCLKDRFLNAEPISMGLEVLEHPEKLKTFYEDFGLNYVFDAAVSIEKKNRFDKNSIRVYQFFIPESLRVTPAFETFLDDASDLSLPSLPVEVGGNEAHLQEYSKRHYMFGC